MKNSFTLKEIADWQLNAAQSVVDLPLIQRGFVWRTKQIEDLWDSLLRGYPIGAFLLSKTGDRYHMMDGQQRSTAIFLGYSNPYKQNDNAKLWSIKGEVPVVWIDIRPVDKPISSKYSIRLTTQSHPWGYQSVHNEKKLTVSDRRKALELFRKDPSNAGLYTAFKNTSVFPYDSSFPIPLSFLLESKNTDEVVAAVEKNLPFFFSTKHGGFKTKDEYINLLRTDLENDLKEIFDTVKQLSKTTVNTVVIDDHVLHEEQQEEQPTLFVRINSAGTPLNGDDLIYSIYKSIFPEAKDLIDEIGFSFIAPTQVLSMASRIVASDLDSWKYVKRMNVKDFQRRIKDDDFKSNLHNLIANKTLKDLFARAIDILSGINNVHFDGGMPAITVKNLISKHEDLFLFLVYWLYINRTDSDDSIRLKMMGKLYTFAWFEFDNIPRLWNEYIEDKSFWSLPINDLIWWDGHSGIHMLIHPNLLRDYYSDPKVEDMFIHNDENPWGLLPGHTGEKIDQYMKSIKQTDLSQEQVNEYFWKFIGRIQYNKHLILLAQRHYVNKTFPEFNQIEDFEDTNVPWDWDHIYPSEWVYRKEKCNRSIKYWNNTNGNLRAISLEENRSRGNYQAPGDLVEETERSRSFITNADWENWRKIKERIFHDEAYDYFRAVTTRMINIYEEYWNSLKIGELLVEPDEL